MRFFILLLLTSFFCTFAQASTPSLQGEWKLTAMIYRGATIPPLNPNLNLRWTFFANGSNRLYWDRTNETGFCESFANYTLHDGQIFAKVFAVNPLNRQDCAKDPDMQVGRETSNKIEIQKQQILLHLQLGDEELIYILKEIL